MAVQILVRTNTTRVNGGVTVKTLIVVFMCALIITPAARNLKFEYPYSRLNFVGEKYVYCSKWEYLESMFMLHGYSMDSDTIPKIYITAFPRNMSEIPDITRRKKLFILTVLPLVLKVNQEIMEDRKLLETIEASYNEMEKLLFLCKKYALDEPNIEELKKRINPVPIWQALAQAAVESGWGTGRFVHYANNLFGEQVFKKGLGLEPLEKPDGASYEVKIFPSLLDSVRSYVHNLNTHPYYDDYRIMRMEKDDIELLNSLKMYSIEREEYVRKLRTIVVQNNLLELERFVSPPNDESSLPGGRACY